MARLPMPGGDEGGWGDILNDFLLQAHTEDGTIKESSITATHLADNSVGVNTIAPWSVNESKLSSALQTKISELEDGVKGEKGEKGDPGPQIVIDPRDFGATPLPDGGGGGADSTEAIQAAIAAASSPRTADDVPKRIHLSAWYKVTSDIVLKDSNITITGEGGGSGLIFVNSGLILDASESLVQWQALREVRVRRVTTSGEPHGVAVDVNGNGEGTENFNCRFTFENCHFEAPVNPTGTRPEDSVALRIRGAFLSTITNTYLRNAYTGLVIDNDAYTGTLAANAITFSGGEIQAVSNIGRITNALGISFFGMTWEGADLSGMDVNDTSGLTIAGCYWEANADFDLRVGAISGCSGVTVSGGVASVGAMVGKERSIILNRSRGTEIHGMTFMDYAASPVLVNELDPAYVTGNCRTSVHYPLIVEVVDVQSGLNWGAEKFYDLTIGSSDKGERPTLIKIDGTNGQQHAVQYRTDGALRWVQGTDAITESGSNGGSDWQLLAYSDSEDYLGTVMKAFRNDQQLSIYGPLRHEGERLGFFGRTPATKPTVTGSLTNGEATASLINALVDLGLITDNTTP